MSAFGSAFSSDPFTGLGSTDNNNDNSGGDNDIFHELESQSLYLATQTIVDGPSETDTARDDADPLFSTSSPTSPTSTSFPTFTSTADSSSSTPTSTSDITTPTAISTSASSSIIPSPTASTDAATSGSSKSGPNSAGIAVLVIILVLALCGAAFWFIRRKYVRERQDRRTTWVRSPIQEFVENDMEANLKHEGRFDSVDMNEKEPVEFIEYPTRPQVQVNMPVAPPALHAAGYAPPRMPSPPPVTVTSPGAVSPVPIGVQAPSVSNAPYPSTTFAPVASRIASGTLVYVARTFVPTLPDELSIQTGEQIRVISRFDDGWAHVERMRSGAGVESGVVPVECLEPISAPAGNGVAAGLPQEAVEGWRLSKRKSSLAPAGPAQY